MSEFMPPFHRSQKSVQVVIEMFENADQYIKKVTPQFSDDIFSLDLFISSFYEVELLSKTGLMLKI